MSTPALDHAHWTLANMAFLQNQAFPGQQTASLWQLDLSHLSHFDSSALALILHWRRQAHQKQVQWEVINAPIELHHLAKVYGVEALLGW